MSTFLSDSGKAALLSAVREVEAGSAAEVLIAVRVQSGTYLHADLLAALVASMFALAFALYSPWPVANHYILLDAIFVACAAGWLSRQTPSVRRFLSSARSQQTAVDREARATFVDKRVSETRGRTGLLIYVSELERKVSVVSDYGVLKAVDDARFHACVAAMAATGGDAGELAKALRELGKVLATALPRDEGDCNELADEVHG